MIDFEFDRDLSQVAISIPARDSSKNEGVDRIEFLWDCGVDSYTAGWRRFRRGSLKPAKTIHAGPKP